MGVDLNTFGKHTIDFNGKTYLELTTEIKAKLDKIEITNLEYIKHALLDFYRDKEWLDGITDHIKKLHKWHFEEEDYRWTEDKYITLYGPHNLELAFDEHKIFFWDPPYRYNYWFHWIEKLHRDEWRKYFYQIITGFGGNRAIYLPDNMSESSKYAQECDDWTFEEIENGLIKDYGKFEKPLHEIKEEDDCWYYIDYFKDIDWSKNAPIDEFLPKP